jgi:hypothetical protein
MTGLVRTRDCIGLALCLVLGAGGSFAAIVIIAATR